MVEIINQYSYESQQINQLLEQLRREKITGILNFRSQKDSGDRVFSYFLVWKNGEITYGNSHLTPAHEIVKQLLQKLSPKMANAALKFVCQKLNNSNSIQEYLSVLVKVKALQWKQIEQEIGNQVVSILEQLSLYSGTAQLSSDDFAQFNISFDDDGHSLNWSSLKQKLKQRDDKWQILATKNITLEAIPQPEQSSLVAITKPSVRQHILKFIDGKRSLMEIAYQLNQDSLKIALVYRDWLSSGWISFGGDHATVGVTGTEKEKQRPHVANTQLSNIHSGAQLPTILSVDDSLVVQANIKRALQDEYNVVFSDNAMDALKILNNTEINLLLLDVMMPDIDGLQMCKTLRTISKFKNLPIVMVTAKDTLIDKMKGQIAGTDHYLNKPFTNEQLKKLIHKFIPVTT